jgi:hypothetical protein
MEVGSYAHRPILHDPDEIPSNEEAPLSPTELPFTDDDFDPQMEQALELMEMLGDAEIKHAINGLLSLTPDGDARARRDARGAQPVVGGRGVDQGGPRGRPARRRVDDHGYPDVDPHGVPTSPASTRTSAPAHIYARAAEHFNKTYGIVHPREQWASRTAACAAARSTPAKRRSAPCSSRPAAGSARSGTSRTPTSSSEYGVACEQREHEWDARWWSPIINAEHLHMREHGSAWSTSPPSTSSTSIGPGALDYLDRMASTSTARSGGSIYTPMLTADGGFRQRPHDHAPRRRALPVITGGSTGPRQVVVLRITCRPTVR